MTGKSKEDCKDWDCSCYKKDKDCACKDCKKCEPSAMHKNGKNEKHKDKDKDKKHKDEKHKHTK